MNSFDFEQLAGLVSAMILGPALTQTAKRWPWVRDYATTVNAVFALALGVTGWALTGEGSWWSWAVAALAGGKLGAVGYNMVHERRKPTGGVEAVEEDDPVLGRVLR